MKVNPGIAAVGSMSRVAAFRSLLERWDPAKTAAIAGIRRLPRIVIVGEVTPALCKAKPTPAKSPMIDPKQMRISATSILMISVRVGGRAGSAEEADNLGDMISIL